MACPPRCFHEYPVPSLPADATRIARDAPGGTRSIGPGPGIKRDRDVGAQPLTLTNPLPQLHDALSYPFENLPGFSEATFGIRAASQALRGHPAEAAGNAALALAAPILGGVLGRRAVSIARKAEATGTWHLVANEARDLSLLPSRTSAQARKLRALNDALRSAPQEALPPLAESAMSSTSRTANPLNWKLSPAEEATFAQRERRAAERLVPPARRRLSDVAAGYRELAGITHPKLPPITEVPAARGKEMADIYAGLRSAPNDPAVKAGYGQFMREINAQAEALKQAGYTWEFVSKDPYHSSAEMLADLRNNRHIKVLKTEAAQGHPLLTPDENDTFRAVHDILGHGLGGHSFGPKGEELAFREHAALMSPEAQRVLATETRGQNSWFNFGPKSHLPIGQRPFAEQKAALWPESHLGDYQTMNEKVIGAAVKGADGVWYMGPNHGMAADAARAGVKKNLSPAAWAEIKSVIARGSMDSFKTSTGRIVSRDEAAALARKSQQTALAPQYSALHSSDLIPENRAAPNVLVTSPQGRALHDALTRDEASLLRTKDIPQFEAAAAALPRTGAFGAGAIAGAAKLGWYRNTAKALVEAFGPDAPRFAALLSALSPQRDVKNNLSAALSMWEAWTASGRTTDPRRLTILLDQVERAAPGGKAMGPRVPNTIRALTSDEPAKLVLSGPKVDAFHKNLMGDTQRVTLDTWMGQLANVSGESLRGAQRKGVLGAGILGPNPLYSAYSGRVRQTANELTQLTGRAWTPAEVQETLWSWGKALSETAMPSTKGMHPSELKMMSPGDLQGAISGLPESAVRGVPDFSTLLSEPGPFQESLGRMGLRTPAPAPAANVPVPTPDIFELGGLARNIERSRLGLFGLNERGALGNGPGRLVFHGTTTPGYDVPTKFHYGPGVHVGTAGQADEILRGAPWDSPQSMGMGNWRPEGSRIIPLRDLTTNPLQLQKDAAWGDPVEFARNLADQGTATADEAAQLTNFDKIRAFLQAKGYDRIDYRNKVEADRWVGRARPRRVLANSSVILDPEAHLRNALAPDPTDAGLTGLKMLGGMTGVGIGAAGAPWLWNYIHNKQQP